MDRYEKMLECNRKASDEKIERARKAIFELMDEGERVTVPRLMEKTGLSRGFSTRIHQCARHWTRCRSSRAA